MHSIIKKRTTTQVQLFFLDKFIDGDPEFFEPVKVSVLIFQHEARTVSVQGIVKNYSTTIHVDIADVLAYVDSTPMRVAIKGIEYQINGSSLVYDPLTRKLTTWILKL